MVLLLLEIAIGSKLSTHYVRLLQGSIDASSFSMEDNARPNRNVELLESEDIARNGCQAHSSDLNLIEPSWGGFGNNYNLSTQLESPENVQQTKEMLIEKYELLPQQLLKHQVLSIEKRCFAITAVKVVYILIKGQLILLYPSTNLSYERYSFDKVFVFVSISVRSVHFSASMLSSYF